MTVRELRALLFEIEEQDKSITNLSYHDGTLYMFILTGEGKEEKLYKMKPLTE